jgi:phosphoribosylformylglycinamidine cyclo-ligase
LDYLGTGKLDLQRDLKLIEGIIRGCEEAQCVLVGGETAELPGLYQEEDFELVGFAVGVVERQKLIDGSTIREGDLLLGLSSSGLHSNGYSLVRKLIELHKLSLDSYFEEFGSSLGEELLKPTRIYVKTILKLLEHYPIKGMAHITGGGLPGNIPRILPPGLGVKIHRSWPIPPIFQFLQKLGVKPEEMWRVFNMGIGFVLVVDKEVVSSVMEECDRLGEKAFLIGEIIKGEGVIIE